jgi:hypothetical protein
MDPLACHAAAFARISTVATATASALTRRVRAAFSSMVAPGGTRPWLMVVP